MTDKSAGIKNKWKITLRNLIPGVWFGLIFGTWNGYIYQNPSQLANSNKPIDWAMISSNPFIPYLLNPKYESFVWSIIPLIILGIIYRIPASYVEYATQDKMSFSGIFRRSVLKSLVVFGLCILVYLFLILIGSPSLNPWTFLYKELYGSAYIGLGLLH